MTEAQFHTQYLPLADTLYRVAYYLLESEDAAQDAVQEVYLKLWEGRDKLDEVRNPKAYSITLLRNLCLDRIRKECRLSYPEQLPEAPAPHLQDEEMDSKMRLDQVLEAIKALPDRQREILLLRTVEGLSYDQIAERTGMNPLTLRVLLSRARTTLKKAL